MLYYNRLGHTKIGYSILCHTMICGITGYLVSSRICCVIGYTVSSRLCCVMLGYVILNYSIL